MSTTRKTDGLIPLQDLDLQIHKLKVQRAEKPRLLASSEAAVAHARELVEGMQAEIKALRVDAAQRELSVKEHDEKISKLENQSLSAKKNDEYQAYQKEISGVKADRARVEDGLLDVLMQVDEKGKLEKLRKEELQQAEAEYAVEKKKLEAEIEALDRQIEAEVSKRAGLTAAVDKERLTLYERVLKAKDDGIALAAAEKYEAIEDKGKVTFWQCAGCSIGLNSQDVNILLIGKDIHICRNCSRILYIKPE